MSSQTVSMSTRPRRTSLLLAARTILAAPVSAAVSSCSVNRMGPACRTTSLEAGGRWPRVAAGRSGDEVAMGRHNSDLQAAVDATSVANDARETDDLAAYLREQLAEREIETNDDAWV